MTRERKGLSRKDNATGLLVGVLLIVLSPVWLVIVLGLAAPLIIAALLVLIPLAGARGAFSGRGGDEMSHGCLRLGELAVAGRLDSGRGQGQFLIVEYRAAEGWDPCPYAQCAREVDPGTARSCPRTTCPRTGGRSMSSTFGVVVGCPPQTTPRTGGRRSTRPTALRPSSSLGCGPGACARILTHFTWSIGTFPSGPDGGEPVPVPDYAPLLQAA